MRATRSISGVVGSRAFAGRAGAVIAVLAVFAPGCTTLPGFTVPEGPAIAELLDGSVLFGEPVEAAPRIDERILAPTPDMQAFIERHAARRSTGEGKLHAVLKGMLDEGYLDLVYDDLTLTAAETFATRSGNCLSFTNLFVALARGSGLDVAFQTVEIPPVWEANDAWVIRANHINAIVKGLRTRFDRQDYVVDFNVSDYQGNYPTRRVSDAHAFALYYNNHGVEMLRADDLRRAFAYFKRAIESSPDTSAPWVNLGALYSKRQFYDHADAAYRRALAAEPDDKSALANLARLHEALGNTELADYYGARSRYHRERNPYYHFAHSFAAYERQDFDSAQAPLRRALKLKPDEHQFYYLQALLALERDDKKQAQRSLQKALDLARHERVRQRYAREIEALADAP